MDIPERLQQAYESQCGGDVSEALRVYREILSIEPENFDAWFLFGLAQLQLGRPHDALQPFERALEIRPKNAQALGAYGNALIGVGRIDDAIAALRKAAAAVLVNHEELVNLGNALCQAGRHEEALPHFDAALATKPDLFAGHYNRGVALKALDRKEEAILAFRRALEIKPDLAEAAHNLGSVYESADRIDDACDAYRQAIEARPSYTRPRIALGRLLAETYRVAEGIETLVETTEIDPACADAHYELGRALMLSGRPRDGVESFQRAFTLAPNHADAGFNLSLALLTLGEFEKGWKLYDLRLTTLKQLGGSARVRVSAQMGAVRKRSELRGDRLLVLGEQGLGDEIMFSSILPEILSIVPNTTLTADPRLVGLFNRSFPGLTACAHPPRDGGAIASVPEGRRHFIGSLMKVFRRRPEDFPGTPYLVADPDRRTQMRARLAALGEGRKFGVMWRGGVGGDREHLRSLELEDLQPLLEKSGNHWISLSHLPAADEEVAAFSARTGITIHHWPELLRSDDYDDTAALLAELDGLVSVTGTIAHCAAALGVPAHVLVNRAPEWRYGCQGSRMLWYNAMTLYRQTDHWPIGEVGRELGILDR